MAQLASLSAQDAVVAKVGDFGLSSTLVISGLKEKANRRAVMNPTWLAPEITKARLGVCVFCVVSCAVYV